MGLAESDRKSHPRQRNRNGSVRGVATFAFFGAALFLVIMYHWHNRMPYDRFIKTTQLGVEEISRGMQLDLFHGKPTELKEPPRPRILMVTAVPPKCMESARSARLAAFVIKNHADYATRHSYDFYHTYDELDPQLSPDWNKLLLLRKLMDAHKFQYEWFWWLDHEAVIIDMSFPLPLDKYPMDTSLVLGPSEEWFVYNNPRHGNINLGTFLIKNNAWSKELLDAMQATRADASRQELDTLGNIRSRVRGIPGATDEAVLLYHIHMQRTTEAERKRVYFETITLGGLEGAWKEACAKVDAALKKLPVLVDGEEQPLPFVIHFGGCQFCSLDKEPSSRACPRSFFKAFSFADNQVLEPLQLRHVDVTSTASGFLQELPQAGKDRRRL